MRRRSELSMFGNSKTVVLKAILGSCVEMIFLSLHGSLGSRIMLSNLRGPFGSISNFGTGSHMSSQRQVSSTTSSFMVRILMATEKFENNRQVRCCAMLLR